MGCNFAYFHTTSKYIPTWLFMDPGLIVDLNSSGGSTVEYVDATALNAAKTSYTYPSAVNPSVEV